MPSVLSGLSQSPSVLGNLPGSPGPTMPPSEPPDLTHRAFTDPTETRKLIYDRVLTQMKNIGPLQNARHTLELINPEYVDSEHVPIQKQKEAILASKSLHRRIKGTWKLTDNATGNVMDQKEMTIAQVPHMTPRGTFVINGTEYSLSNQMRLRPGVFTRVKENGEIESHVNVMPGNGISHRYFLDPETGVFKINIGQAKLPLLPVMKALGVSDSELRKAWGDELHGLNLQVPDGKTVSKLYQRLVRKGDPDATDEVKAQTLSELFHAMRLDPEVTKRTLGNPHTHLTKDAILDTTKKLIAVSKKEQEPDDRDHLAYQTLHGPEDLLAERITKDRTFLRQLLWKSSFKGNLSGIQPGVLTKQLHHTLLHTGLGQAVEEINPAELLDSQGRATRLGEGGIGSMDAVPDEARNVQPSHFCYDDATYVYTDTGWLPWRDVTIDTNLITLQDGVAQFATPTAVLHDEYSGQMIGLQTKLIDYLVTPNHRLFVSTPKQPDRWNIDTAGAVYGRRRRFLQRMGAVHYTGDSIFALPEPEHNHAHRGQLPYGDIHIDMGNWCDFLGWYISEGWCQVKVGKNTSYRVTISQSQTANPEKCARIRQLLEKLPFHFTYNEKIQAFVINSKHLASYLLQFGHAGDKYLPDYVFRQSLATRIRLLDSLQAGDGTIDYRYTTSSEQLAFDVHALSCSVGYTASICPMDSPSHLANPAHALRYRVNVRRSGNEVLTCRDQGQYERGLKDRGHYACEYTGKIHCATVPGGLLYVMRNGRALWSGNSFIDPIRTPESFKVGVDTRISNVARKGKDGKIYAPFTNTKTGQVEYKTPQEVADVAVAFPGELAKNQPYVAAQQGGATKFIPRGEAAYEMPHFENAFSPLANMIPVKSALKGQRMAMGSRYLAQALPMVNRQAPYLQSAMPGRHMEKSFEDQYGNHMGALRAKDAGTVKKVTPDAITVKYDDGSVENHELYNHFPFSRKTFIHNTAVVQPGQRIDKDSLLAKSNYTDDNGTAALGLNARIAFIPFRGANYEDAAVVSQSMAKRMTSEHMYQHDQEWNDNIKKGLKPFISLFPTQYEKQQLKNMDDHGVIKPGTEVKFGDPLVLVAEQRENTHSQIHRGRKPTFSNKTLTWEHHTPGIVTDVAHTGKGVTVAVKAEVPMEVGDKLSNRYGGKGVVAEIIPDEQMPQDAEGNPYEIALNPLGMISRINPVQIHEMVLGKIAAKTGKPYKVEDFSKINDLVDFVKGERQKHGIKDTETITDPTTGRQVPNVLTGYQYMLKLHHTAEAKGQGRGIGGYTAEDIPARGGAGGSKKIGMLETNALLSHGATEFLRDAHIVRGQRNDNYWQQFMSGFRPPEPEVPRIYQKFVDSMIGSGINVVRHGRQLHVMALTDKDVDKLAGDREIQNADTVDWKEGLKPKRGGLFDPALTGGHGGNRWSKITLHEPLPNPAFEEPIRRILGLTQKKFEGVIAGTEPLGEKGTGPAAIKEALGEINLRKAIEQASAEANGTKKTMRDEALRKLKYLKDAERIGIHPKDWMLSAVPVIPPIYRHVAVLSGSGSQQVGDANYLYKELFDANQLLKDAKGAGIGDVSNERKTAYDALKGVVGLGEPITPKNQERQVKGILKHVFGTQPKFSMMQRQLMGATVEMVGRAVITPNPDFDMDQVGLPENKAWEVYKPFVIRHLVQKGVPRLEAARAFKDQAPMARDALLKEMNNRPVVISRAPVLHRYGIMGAWPKLVKGDVMQLPPIVTHGYNADFDGDTMNYHVPATEEARKEVIEKMLPSRNLLSSANFQAHYVPSMEYQGGLYHATTAKNEKARPHVFNTTADAIRAYHEGRIALDSPVEIVKH